MPPDKVLAYAFLWSVNFKFSKISSVFLFFFGTPYKPAWSSNNSAGEKKGSILSSCGTIPILNLLNFMYLSIFIPQTLTSPEFFLTKPPSIFMKVDFPAPFGPNKPWIVPFFIEILKSIRASTSWVFFKKVLFTFFASIEYL